MNVKSLAILGSWCLHQVTLNNLARTPRNPSTGSQMLIHRIRPRHRKRL